MVSTGGVNNNGVEEMEGNKRSIGQANNTSTDHLGMLFRHITYPGLPF